MKFRVDGQDLRRAEQLFRKLPRELKNALRREQRAQALPVWREEINARKDVTPLAARVYSAGITVKTGAALVLVAQGSSRKIGSRKIPLYTLRGAAEFGAAGGNFTRYYRRSPDGTAHIITRRTRRGLPGVQRRGYVAIPAGAAAISRIRSLSIQTTMKQLHDAAEGH